MAARAARAVPASEIDPIQPRRAAAHAPIPGPPVRLRPSTGAVVAVARCADCGLDLGATPITNWERLHLPTNPWAALVALAELHRAGCVPIAVLPTEASAAERLRAIEAWARRCSSDCGGLMALGSHVRTLLATDAGGGVR